jgi:DOPA 4,5-dioxygenase
MDPHSYTHPLPLAGYENLEPLPTSVYHLTQPKPPIIPIITTDHIPRSEKSPDGKSLLNLPSKGLSSAYSAFVDPIKKDERSGFDIHIYFLQTNEVEKKYAIELHERIRRECTFHFPSPPPPPPPSSLGATHR